MAPVPARCIGNGRGRRRHDAPPLIAGHEVEKADSPIDGSLFVLEGALRFTGEPGAVAGTTGANVTVPMSDGR